PDRFALARVLAQLEARWRDDNDRGAVMEVAELVAFPVRRPAGDAIRSPIFQIERNIDEVQVNARYENRRHGDEHDSSVAIREPRVDDGTLVLAVQTGDAPQRHRVDIPHVAGHIRRVVNLAIGGGMEPVVHRRGQAQRHVGAAAVGVNGSTIAAKEIVERIGAAFGPGQTIAAHAAAGADDGAAGAEGPARIGIDRPHSRLELADEAVVHAPEARLLRLVEAQVAGEQRPRADRQIADDRLLDAAEPADEARG